MLDSVLLRRVFAGLDTFFDLWESWRIEKIAFCRRLGPRILVRC